MLISYLANSTLKNELTYDLNTNTLTVIKVRKVRNLRARRTQETNHKKTEKSTTKNLRKCTTKIQISK